MQHNKRIWIAIVTAMSVAAIVVWAFPAQAIQTFNLITCNSNAACTGGSNSGTGPGVQGTSALGKGVVGQTTFDSSSITNGQFGILGQDLSTSGKFDSGVGGTSKRGNGVVGSTSASNQSLSNIHAGVLGSSSGTSQGVGVYGTSATGPGVVGNSTLVNGPGVFGASTNGPGIEGVGGTGSTSEGVGAENASATSPTLFVSNDAGGPVIQADNPARTLSVMTVDSSGDMNLNGHLTLGGGCTGCASVSTPTVSGKPVISFALRTTAPLMEDVGEAQLTRGSAYVAIHPAFLNVVNRGASYFVFVTAEGPSRGLFIATKTSNGFVVKENPGGDSDTLFEYRLVAKAI